MLTFDPDTHIYTLDGMQIPSVTQILSGVGMVDGRFFTEEARTRGTYVHRATEYIDKGSLDWSILDDTLRPYCEAYQRFVEDCRPEIIISEKPLYHAQHLFAGTLDRVVKMHDRIMIVDIKTGAMSPANWLQVAAYRELVQVNEDIHAIQGAILCLQGDGKYRLKTSSLKDMKRDYQIFLAALTVVRWKGEHA